MSAILEEIPSQLQQHEKKFRLSALQDDARMRDYSQAFFWLSDARVVNYCYNSTEPSIGLKLNDDRMEIDFLIAKPTTTSKHNISPVEVKSGSRYTLTSLTKCIKKYAKDLSTPYVLHDKDVKIEGGIVFLPLIMQHYRK